MNLAFPMELFGLSHFLKLKVKICAVPQFVFAIFSNIFYRALIEPL